MNTTFDMTFTGQEATYGVDVEENGRVRTYILDGRGQPDFGKDTSDTQNWPHFYALGWTKAELTQGFKESWREYVQERIDQNEFHEEDEEA